jgi:hypothetical protein
MYINKNATFYIKGDDIGFSTKLQSFYLKAKEPYYYKRMRSIKFLIRIGEINSVETLCHYTENKIGIYPKYRAWNEKENIC